MVALILAATLLVPSPVVLTSRNVRGAKCEVIQADLSDGRLEARVVLAEGFPGTDESFSSMVARSGAVAAVNGAYFDKYSKKPIGDIWTDGQLWNRGLMGTALCLGEEGEIDIQRVVRHKGVDWSAYRSVLACGPALVLDGRIDCDWASEGFRDPSVTGSTYRMGVGYTQAGKLLLVMCRKSVTFEAFAAIMADLGCYEAMNLDAGASLAMWFQGKTIRQAGRRLTNLLVIGKKRS